jgi:N6-adenosine-specific RNA methylase IME4
MSLKQVNTTLDLELVTTNPEYESLIPPLTKEEYQKLRDSIKEKGLWEPITVNQRNVILDGHNRFKICKQLNIMPRFSVRAFEDPLDEKLYVIDSNLIRRHLQPIVKVELYLKREDIVAEDARQRQKATQLIGRGIQEKDVNGGGNITGTIRGDTRDIMGAKIGISGSTYNKAKTVLEKASPEMIQKVRDGKTSISYAYKSITLADKHRTQPPMPEGIYNVIYADPPWEYNIMTRGAPNEHYETMHDQDVYNLKIPASENAILFLWATNPKLPEALKVIEAWGFEYKTNMVWVKNGLGIGYYVRGNHELLLIAKRGNIPPPMEANRPPSTIVADTTEHSKKPEQVYSIIEQMYPVGKYLELFARNTRPNWTSWGNEV